MLRGEPVPQLRGSREPCVPDLHRTVRDRAWRAPYTASTTAVAPARSARHERMRSRASGTAATQRAECFEHGQIRFARTILLDTLTREIDKGQLGQLADELLDQRRLADAGISRNPEPRIDCRSRRCPPRRCAVSRAARCARSWPLAAPALAVGFTSTDRRHTCRGARRNRCTENHTDKPIPRREAVSIYRGFAAGSDSAVRTWLIVVLRTDSLTCR